MNHLVMYAFQFIGVPYKWGGDSPLVGLDCSGLVQVILKGAGIDPPGDQTAQALFDIFKDCENRPQTGALSFYGMSPKNITHVGFCVSSYSMIEAGGGGRNTLTLSDAQRDNAFVRLSPINSRRDLVACLMPRYRGV